MFWSWWYAKQKYRGMFETQSPETRQVQERLDICNPVSIVMEIKNGSTCTKYSKCNILWDVNTVRGESRNIATYPTNKSYCSFWFCIINLNVRHIACGWKVQSIFRWEKFQLLYGIHFVIDYFRVNRKDTTKIWMDSAKNEGNKWGLKKC